MNDDETGNMSADYCVELGQEHFKEARYEEAYKASEAALTLLPDHVEALKLQLIAGRKLKQKPQLLQISAEKFMDASPTTGIGYLCYCEWLLSKGKLVEALDLLKSATRFRVLHDDPHKDQMHDLLYRIRKTPLNFLVGLPPDVLCQVFSFLSFKDKVHCAAVSRVWRYVLTNIPFLWRDIHIECPPGKELITVPAIKRYSEWATSHIRSLRIPLSHEVLSLLSRPPFHHLRQVDFSADTDEVMDPVIFGLIMEEVAEPWRHLGFNGTITPVKTVLECLLAYCPKIQSLTLHRDVLMEPLEVTNQALDAIEELRLLGCPTMQHRDIGAICNLCPNVKHLHLGECYALVCQTTFAELSKLKHLKKLSLYFTTDYRYSTSSIREYLQGQPLEVLELPDCRLRGYIILDIIEVMTQGMVIWQDKGYSVSDEHARMALVKDIRSYDAEREREQAHHRSHRPRVRYRGRRQAHYAHVDYYHNDHEYDSEEDDQYDEELADFVVNDGYSDSEDDEYDDDGEYQDDSATSNGEEDNDSEEPEAYED
ncbi:hypothetical protein BCR43DRAFT_524392 [Syncephalastrum racemosum]|uniref:F-box domain-containing protein n=1 Tax=Syncephalastrum racemosum TaxID=13706 RepID=A0A1X2HBW9_SYNRA|nr:hypothetical protein BCR43DRAFT_524392 [Syncephalastrum racemosum]